MIHTTCLLFHVLNFNYWFFFGTPGFASYAEVKQADKNIRQTPIINNNFIANISSFNK